MKKTSLILILLLTTFPLHATQTRFYGNAEQRAEPGDPHSDQLLPRLNELLDVVSTSLNFSTNPEDRKRLNSVMKLKKLQKRLSEEREHRSFRDMFAIEKSHSSDNRALSDYQEIIDTLASAHPDSDLDDFSLLSRSYKVTTHTANDVLDIAIEDFILSNKSCLLLEGTSTLQTIERVFLKSLVQTIYAVAYAHSAKGQSQVEKNIKPPAVNWEHIGLMSFKVMGKWAVDEAIPNHHVGTVQRACELIIPYCVAYAAAHGAEHIGLIDDVRKAPSPTVGAVGIDILSSGIKARFYTESSQLRPLAIGTAWGLPLFLALSPKKFFDEEYPVQPLNKVALSALTRLANAEILPGVGSYGIRYLPEQIQSGPRNKAVIGLVTLLIPALFTMAKNRFTAAA